MKCKSFVSFWSVSASPGCISKWPLVGMSCLKPDFCVLSFALYGAGRTSWEQCQSIIQHLFLPKAEGSLPWEPVEDWTDRHSPLVQFAHFTLMNSVISLVTTDVILITWGSWLCLSWIYSFFNLSGHGLCRAWITVPLIAHGDPQPLTYLGRLSVTWLHHCFRHKASRRRASLMLSVQDLLSFVYEL